MAENAGNSNIITRKYLDSLLIQTRYMNADYPDPSFELYGKEFPSPIMTAALSHLDHFMFEGAAKAFAQGAADSGLLTWYGMADEEEIEMILSCGGTLIEVIKPYADRDIIYRKIEHAKEKGVLAVGIDIDHAFSPDGGPDEVSGYTMAPMTTAELTDICGSTDLPVIVKGVLSLYDTEEVLKAGARGIVISHHNNRIEFAVPPLKILPEIAKEIDNTIPIFVDCEIRSGMDAFKAIALGADAVCIGRPLMTAIKDNGAQGVYDYLKKAEDDFKKTMAFTGCKSIADIKNYKLITMI